MKWISRETNARAIIVEKEKEKNEIARRKWSCRVISTITS